MLFLRFPSLKRFEDVLEGQKQGQVYSVKIDFFYIFLTLSLIDRVKIMFILKKNTFMQGL
ncbi:hypothetical protein CLV98_101643 [Dyadobacter jejuensis]|uniref:Uncharacterized protein n=1 Tax=Dyadobacter jejuensis TaxID=1082580 RepID=A0A316AT30_9BACT|nr:hypothetical protein CLV98_101643 [Dyadobacter jejuensis]